MEKVLENVKGFLSKSGEYLYKYPKELFLSGLFLYFLLGILWIPKFVSYEINRYYWLPESKAIAAKILFLKGIFTVIFALITNLFAFLIIVFAVSYLLRKRPKLWVILASYLVTVVAYMIIVAIAPIPNTGWLIIAEIIRFALCFIIALYSLKEPESSVFYYTTLILAVFTVIYFTFIITFMSI